MMAGKRVWFDWCDPLDSLSRKTDHILGSKLHPIAFTKRIKDPSSACDSLFSLSPLPPSPAYSKANISIPSHKPLHFRLISFNPLSLHILFPVSLSPAVPIPVSIFRSSGLALLEAFAWPQAISPFSPSAPTKTSIFCMACDTFWPESVAATYALDLRPEQQSYDLQLGQRSCSFPSCLLEPGDSSSNRHDNIKYSLPIYSGVGIGHWWYGWHSSFPHAYSV